MGQNQTIRPFTSESLDKNWTACDNTPSSPFYGHCYTEYDNATAGDAEAMKTSTDGGQTWRAQKSPADGAHVYLRAPTSRYRGGQSHVLPC